MVLLVGRGKILVKSVEKAASIHMASFDTKLLDIVRMFEQLNEKMKQIEAMQMLILTKISEADVSVQAIPQ